MVFSISDQLRVALVEEATYGTTPASPTFEELNVTGSSLKVNIGTVQSRTLTSGRQVADLLRNTLTAGGELPMEFQHADSGKGLDILIRQVLQSDAADAAYQLTTGDPNGAGTGVLELGAFTDANVRVGDIVKLTGTTSGHDGFWRVKSKVGSDEIILDGVTGLTSPANGITVDRGARYDNGSDLTNASNTIEVTNLDQSPPFYEAFLGMQPDTFRLELSAEQIITAAFSFFGSTSDGVGATLRTAALAGATYNAPPTDPFLNSINDLDTLRIAGATVDATTFSITLSNGLRARPKLGQLGAGQPGSGKFSPTGSIGMYFSTRAEYQKFLDNTNSSIALALTDANGKGWSFSFPNVKWSDADKPADSETDIILTMPFQAIRDGTSLTATTSGKTCIVQRWD